MKEYLLIIAIEQDKINGWILDMYIDYDYYLYLFYKLYIF